MFLFLPIPRFLKQSVLLALAGVLLAAPATWAQHLLRIGRFPTVTHAPALVAQEQKAFEKALGPDTTVTWTVFTAGPSAVEALFAGAIDLAYMGPNPAVNAYVRSGGAALRIIAGATGGGAAFVVRPSLKDVPAARLKDHRFASVQIGSTQDVALRHYLTTHGLNPAAHVLALRGPDILMAYHSGHIDGAWLVEPWASRLELAEGAAVRFEEAALWPGGAYPTTYLVAATPYLEQHPDVIRQLLAAHVDLLQWMNAHPGDAKALTNRRLAVDTGAPLPAALLDRAWGRLTMGHAPLADTLHENADRAKALNFLGRHPIPITGIFHLQPLNEVLKENGLPAVAGLTRSTP